MLIMILGGQRLCLLSIEWIFQLARKCCNFIAVSLEKPLASVKDLGYTLNACERAKEKLERKYGGERHLQIKTPDCSAWLA